jgi:hypothetical protein
VRSPYEYLAVGTILIGGFRYWWAHLKAFLQRILNPVCDHSHDLPPLEPIQERECCISCGRLVQHDMMAWDGDRYVCDDCSWLDAI